MNQQAIKIMLRSMVGLLIGLSLGLVLVYFAGEKPLAILQIIGKSACGSWYDLGVTLYYATPLMFTGLSVAVAFHAGLFNIGAEGQLNIAAMAVALVACHQVPTAVAPFVAIAVAVMVGGFWGWIPGWLRARRGSHEVINTIMLNFISAAITSWLITSGFQNPASQNPETAPVAPGYMMRSWDPIARLFNDAPVSLALPVAVLTAIGVWIYLWRTPGGFVLRAVGENEHAARMSGIDVARVRQWAMALAGALAGMVAFGEILGNAGKYKVGFSPDFGFVGIAVALLAANHPLAIIFSALLFGALHKGAADLDIETEYVTRDLSLVIQALVILCVAIFSSVQIKWRKRK